MAWMDLYLIINLVQVHLGKEHSPAEPVNNIVNVQDGIQIDIFGFIEHDVVNAHPKYTPFPTKEQH